MSYILYINSKKSVDSADFVLRTVSNDQPFILFDTIRRDRATTIQGGGEVPLHTEIKIAADDDDHEDRNRRKNTNST